MASSDCPSEIQSNPVEISETNKKHILGNSIRFKESFSSISLIVTIFSVIIYMVNITIDFILGVQYLTSGHLEWGILTIALCIFSLIISQLISFRWLVVDQAPVTLPTIILHCCFLGIIYRYCCVLNILITIVRGKEISSKKGITKLNHQQGDISLLILFESFLESAPQLLLQLYILHEFESWYPWTGVSAFTSFISLVWGIVSYTRAGRNGREDPLIGMALQACWLTSTVLVRMISLLICATVIHTWLVLAFAIHWVGMIIWIAGQHTDFCSTAWEQRMYHAVVGIIYCFTFFNLKEGESRYQALTFYVIAAVENAACLAIFLRFPPELSNHEWLHSAAPIMIVAGCLLGHASQLVYYRWFHPTGPIKMGFSTSRPSSSNAAEGGPSTSPTFPSTGKHRTLKQICPLRQFSGVSILSLPSEPIESTLSLERVESKLELANNNSEVKEVAVEIEPPVREKAPVIDPVRIVASKSDSKLLKTSPKSPHILLLKTSKSDGQIVPHGSLEKRLRELLTSNICDDELSEGASSFCVSVHDYENMAAINVNRTEWGVRHWKTYSDIECSYHDNSICRGREDVDYSMTSSTGSDAASVITALNDCSKISIQEAISQLKALANNGYNIYQPSVSTADEPGLYECIWSNQPTFEVDEGIVLVPVNLIKPCPTTGHNLSTITEESEISSSKSSLVLTVDTIMDGSLATEDNSENLTYVEVSFLSKLDASDTEVKCNRPRRQFSLVREKFENSKRCSSESNKENIVPKSSSPISHYNSSRKSTHSLHSRIFTA